MTPETLIKIAKFHNVSVDYLLELTDNPNPYPKNNQNYRSTVYTVDFFLDIHLKI